MVNGFCARATGYVGGRLLSLLEQRGALVRCLPAQPEALRRRVGTSTETVAGDVLDAASLAVAFAASSAPFYAEMKLPGRAWLEFEVTGDEQRSTIRQTAIFDPIGFSGSLYWYGIYPLHQFVFAGMLRNLASFTSGNASYSRIATL